MGHAFKLSATPTTGQRLPELPEVERAVVALRSHLVGRRIASLDVHHPALRRRITSRERRSLVGVGVTTVRRRGKHQLIGLDDGRMLHAHFRMTGDWRFGIDVRGARYPRATLKLNDGSAIVLDDPRALSTIVVLAPGVDAVPRLGPDADDPSLDAPWLVRRLAERRISIKVALLDQAVMAGIGNIYASEALWRARIDPRRAAKSLDRKDVGRLLTAIRAVLRRASGARYAEGARFDVYDRARQPCRRCSTPISCLTQSGRSTYWCPRCQKKNLK